MKTKITLVIAFAIVAVQLSAQKFAIPLEGFSRQKTAYLHMEDGTTTEGLLGGFKRSKGLIETVKMKNPNGKKIQIDPAKISYMYLPPSTLGKLGVMNEKLYDINNWEKETNMDTTLINEGYVYFEKSNTTVKKKTEDLMLQLMNASFCEKIKVYHDPFAKETMSYSPGGIKVAGGIDKSYYVKKDSEKTAYRLLKKDYDEQFSKLFGDSPEFIKKYNKKIKWSDLEMHIYEYTQMMK